MKTKDGVALRPCPLVMLSITYNMSFNQGR